MRSLLLLSALLAAATPSTLACSRVAMASPNGTASVAGRTMDWPQDTKPDLVASAVGVPRDGGLGPRSLAWTAKHGSLCTWFQGLGCVDGMNSAGLSGGMNFLAEGVIATVAEAKAADPATTPPLLSVTQWLQQALDLYATVDEAVAALGAKNPAPYTLATLTLSTGDKALGHLMLTDKTGASAIVEPTAAGLAVYKSSNGSADVTGDALAVMTNGPFLPDMLALDRYVNSADGVATGRGLPASSSSPDRFLRAAYWRRRTPVPADPASAAAAVRSIMRTVSSPIGGATRSSTRPGGAPEASGTQWFSVADMIRGVYWLEPARSLAVTVVKLADLNLEDASTPVRKLETGTRQAELGGQVPLDAWKVVAPSSLPGMVGFKAAEAS